MSTEIIQLTWETQQLLFDYSSDERLSLHLRKLNRRKSIILRLYLEDHMTYEELMIQFDRIAMTNKGKKGKTDYFARKNNVSRKNIVKDRLQLKLSLRDLDIN
tara:strand:+ start:1853 stop:2161 length:309 start_codon:yes stop_codon:yes gene_type:complete